jgi:hypothetical protein
VLIADGATATTAPAPKIPVLWRVGSDEKEGRRVERQLGLVLVKR